MRFGYQTIIWGARPADFRGMFSCISKNGFRGVEIAQSRAYLPPADELRQLLEAYDLTLLSLCGGRLEDRIAYCQEGGLEPLYFYVERLDDTALAQDCRLALYPRAYTELIHPDRMRKELAAHEDVLFLPDTAHLYMAHVNCTEVIEEYWGRLASVHLKDWDSIYGRSYQRYPRGFSQLGEGEVRPEIVLEYLREKEYDGWVVVECDCSKTTPEAYVQGAAEWLRENNTPLVGGSDLGAEVLLPSGKPIWLLENPTHDPLVGCSESKAGCLYRGLFQQLRKDSLADFGRGILENISALLGFVLNAQLWEYSPTNRILGLLADYPEGIIKPEHFILDESLCLGGETIAARTVSRMDPSNPPEGRKLFCQEVLGDGTCKHIITVPIFNSCNSNQIELILSLGLKRPLDGISDARFLDFADIIALIYETALDDLCMTAASAIEQKLARENRFSPYLKAAAERIREIMHCEGISLFLPDQARKRLYCEGSTGIVWDTAIDAQYYEPGDGSWTGRVWESNEPVILYVPSEKHRTKSQEDVKHPNLKVSMILPMRDAQGQAIGVLRCRNRTEHRQMFAESDLALADAICHTLVPNLLTLQQSDRFRRTIDRMIHEIKMPLTAIRGANDVMAREMKLRSVKFAHDYVGDVASWLALQEQQIKRVDWYRYKVAGRDDRLKPKYAPVMMLRDVVAPASQHILPMLRERGFSQSKITNDGMYHIPPLFLDKAMFQQVFFNLLGNAVKYCYKDPQSFQMHIWTDRDESGFLIMFEDCGHGIPEGYEEVIFEPYVRAPGMDRCDSTGDGLGLLLVREIIHAHGGKVWVSKNQQPTQFTIFLPRSLSYRHSATDD